MPDAWMVLSSFSKIKLTEGKDNLNKHEAKKNSIKIKSRKEEWFFHAYLGKGEEIGGYK